MRPILSAEETHKRVRNAVIQDLHYWINHPQSLRGQYARITLPRVVMRTIRELPASLRLKVPNEDAAVAGYYRCAQRIMTEVREVPESINQYGSLTGHTQGNLILNGAGATDIFYDIDPKSKKIDVEPIVLCIPGVGSKAYVSGPETWNFASECHQWGLSSSRPH